MLIFWFNLEAITMAEYKFDQAVGLPCIIGKAHCCVLAAFVCSKLDTETLKQGVKYVQS